MTVAAPALFDERVAANSRIYRIALKSRTSAHHLIPEDWQTKVQGVAGIEILATTPRLLRVQADEATIATVIQRVQAHCTVEAEND